MAKLAKKVLSFDPSASTDVVAYNVRILLDGTPFSYDEPHDAIPPDVDPDTGRVSVDIASLPLAPAVDGVFDVYVTAEDDFGNESDPLEVPNANFDFSPPAAPTDGQIG